MLLLDLIPGAVHCINFLQHLLLWLFRGLALWSLQHHVSLTCIWHVVTTSDPKLSHLVRVSASPVHRWSLKAGHESLSHECQPGSSSICCWPYTKSFPGRFLLPLSFEALHMGCELLRPDLTMKTCDVIHQNMRVLFFCSLLWVCMHCSPGLSGMIRRPTSSLSSEPERGSPLIAGLHRTGSEQYVAEPLSPSFVPMVRSGTYLQNNSAADRRGSLIFHFLLTCRNICGSNHPLQAHLSRVELQGSACRCTRYAKTCRQA